MATRTMAVLGVALAIGAGGVPPAGASVWSGSCALELTFSFSSRVRSAPSLSNPGYSIAVAPLEDLNPTTETVEPCAVTLVGLNPFRTTSVKASGSSSLWTCESVLASGSWNQSWSPDPPAVIADHTITGTWGAWTMAVKNSSLSFAGTMHLTLHPDEASKLAQCETAGITSLKMVGVMVFQDPETPVARGAIALSRVA